MNPSPSMASIRQRVFFAILYFSEGAPIGYVWWAMPTRLRSAGMPVDEVAALTALLTLPWALKFLWAPAVDAVRGPRWGHRAWITAAQLAMGAALLPLGLAPLDDIIGIAKWLLLLHAFCAATQDVAIDALAIATVPEAEHGRLTGWMQAGMLVGRAIFGGLALTAERWIGAEGVVLVLIGCVWLTLVVVWTFPVRHAGAESTGSTRRRFASGLAGMLARRSTWFGIAIALLAGAGFEAVGGLIGPYLIDRGVPQERIGWFLALPVVMCMIVGGIAGGWAADRVGHRRLVAASIIGIGVCVGGLIALDGWAGATGGRLMVAAIPLYVFIGALTASCYALFMDLSDPSVGGTQFSAFMGATNLCEVWAVALAGRLVVWSGYPAAFGVTALLSLIALALLPLTRSERAVPAVP